VPRDADRQAQDCTGHSPYRGSFQYRGGTGSRIACERLDEVVKLLPCRYRGRGEDNAEAGDHRQTTRPTPSAALRGGDLLTGPFPANQSKGSSGAHQRPQGSAGARPPRLQVRTPPAQARHQYQARVTPRPDLAPCSIPRSPEPGASSDTSRPSATSPRKRHVFTARRRRHGDERSPLKRIWSCRRSQT